jgi:UDP-N-acetylmuramate--alanine ligase
VAEADESDGSFLKLNPTIAVITNIDREHMDFFKDIEMLKHAFLAFINKIPFYGIAVVCRENEYIREIIPLIQRKIMTYGLSEDADIYAMNIKHLGTKTSFEAVFRGSPLGTFILPIPGIHNVLNSLAAIAVGLELQIPVENISKAISNFSGIHRRFEFKGEAEGVRVFDDYGHHPSEITATIKAAKECFGDRLFVLFQPHRYTRTRDLIDEFASCFAASLNNTDKLFLMDIYPAGEPPIDGINSGNLLVKIQEAGFKDVSYVSDRLEIVKRIISDLKSGDVLITLGAGDVYKIGEEILKKLSK